MKSIVGDQRRCNKQRKTNTHKKGPRERRKQCREEWEDIVRHQIIVWQREDPVKETFAKEALSGGEVGEIESGGERKKEGGKGSTNVEVGQKRYARSLQSRHKGVDSNRKRIYEGEDYRNDLENKGD